jgi:hypothetical protein
MLLHPYTNIQPPFYPLEGGDFKNPLLGYSCYNYKLPVVKISVFQVQRFRLGVDYKSVSQSGLLRLYNICIFIY